MFAMSIGALVGATYSTFYGRRPVYLCTLPVLFIGSIGVSTARSIPSLLTWRFIQAMGASPASVVGTGVIGDIFKIEERGRAMSVFFAATLVGPSLAPLAGGYATHYYSWRAMQGTLGVLGLIAFSFLYFLLPETSQPGERDIDKMKQKKGFTFVNPLRPLWLLRGPTLFAIAIILSACITTVWVQLIPLAYTIGERYNVHNEALIGACFLPSGLGNLVGAVIIGPVSDRTVIRWRQKRGGIWYPEDRLRAALFPILTIVPTSILVSGLVNRFVDGTPGLVLSLICLFANGVGVDMAFGPCAAYLVDIMHSRSAESLAANSALRSLIISVAVAISLPMIDRFGVVETNALCAVLVWISYGALWFIICHGERLRAWVDIGYSVGDTN
ncbi:MFS general substrate transporter [Flammula alnicola]|nr:MFS general substrate transporter [Flammula alnicola]